MSAEIVVPRDLASEPEDIPPCIDCTKFKGHDTGDVSTTTLKAKSSCVWMYILAGSVTASYMCNTCDKPDQTTNNNYKLLVIIHCSVHVCFTCKI